MSLQDDVKAVLRDNGFDSSWVTDNLASEIASIFQYHEQVAMPIDQEDIHYRVDLCGKPIAHGANVLWESVRFLEGAGVPAGEVHFVQDGKIVGKITGIGRE